MKLLTFDLNSNFGDVINHDVADRWLSDLVDDDAREQLLLIGTMIERHAPEGRRQYILGAGAGYRAGRPSLVNRHVFAVRGPLTARVLGVDEATSTIDPGILLPEVHAADPAVTPTGRALFVPHWRTDVDCGARWRQACEAAGVDYCSPLEPPRTVLSRIRAATVVITEALHGAIVAEGCGIPWIPVVVGPNVLSFKWLDWCASIGIEWSPVTDLPTLRTGYASWSARLKVHAYRFGIGKDKYRYLRPDPDGDAAIDRAAATLAMLATRGEARHHVGVASLRDAARGRLFDAFERFRRHRRA